MNTATDAKPTVLVVDDDKNTRDGLDRALARTYNVRLAPGADAALGVLKSERVDILLTDVRMPGIDGLVLMRRAIAHDPDLIWILLTAYGNVETAVEAMKQGAYDFLTKPVNLDHLDLLLKRALRTRTVEFENINLQEQLDSKFGMQNMVGSTPAMQRLFEVIRQAAPTQATVLIQGESGTGKELVAHAVHRLSTRAKGPFIAVHCAALAPSLLEAELFGHEKGAFTGAVSRRRGRFEMADGGTLFLDEVSEVGSSVQVKLLRVLEEHQFERVGGDETIDVDLRLIAATNRDLKGLVATGEFREDLFFRLDVINVNLPPLRERAGDIPVLCDHFVREFNERNRKDVQGITSDAVAILSSYAWPGNVRELRNTIEKMVVLARSERLTARDLPPNIRDAVRSEGLIPMRGGGAESLSETERRMILATLRRCGNNRTKAAGELGISRRTLHRKLKQYREEDAQRVE